MRIEVKAVSKSYGPVHALRDVDVTLESGEIHALCGHNGAGKSTLVKLLSGVIRADSGSVAFDGAEVDFKSPLDAQRAGVALVDQELSLVPQLSVTENLLLGQASSSLFTRPRAARPRVKRLLEQVGLGHVSPSAAVAELTIGERQLVEIARAIGRQAGLLILDEPTATLSDSEIEHVFAAARAAAASGSAVVFVSHRLGEVLELCQAISVMRDGECVVSRPSSQFDRASLIEVMLGGVREPEAPPVPPEASDLTVSIAGLRVPPRVSDFDLTLTGGQIVGLAGQVGCGASEVLRALGGLVPEATGTVVVDGRAVPLASPRRAAARGVVYMTGDRKGEGLFLAQTVADNLVATRLPRLSRLGVVQRRARAEAVKHHASVSALRADRTGSRVDELSGGNQQKVLVGRCLEHPGTKLLLFEEPTRGVDVGGRAEIHALVRHAAATGNAVVFASTELDEILELSDVVVTMFGGRVVSIRDRADVTAGSVLAEMTHRVEQQEAAA
jgi:ABC-type sugar transport system ATPase subunit